MRKIYHLSTCSTCKSILAGLKALDSFDLQDVKTTKISNEQLEEMMHLAGSYEALFSRRSRQYAARNLKEKQLSEADYKKLILEEYTFLKRPVIIVDKEIFIGSAAETIDKLKRKLG